MNFRSRVAWLALAFTFCFGFILWPNSSYQSLLFNEIQPLVSTSLSQDARPRDRCQRYFQMLRNLAPSRPSASRYLSSRQIANHVDHLRIYLKCHLEYMLEETPVSAYLADELLPMFSGNLPTTFRPHDWSRFHTPDEYYWSRYVAASKGRGIVISIDDKNVDYASRLLKVLAYMNNTLPIQFIHEGDLSQKSLNSLLKVANNLQHVDFMDVTPTLKRGYASTFQGYNNKWFAALFSTFDEIILMDADVVPFIVPEELFSFEGYKRTGAFFFRDRELSETLSESQYNFFLNMIPRGNSLFDMSIDESKFKNNFFKYRSKHVMESGVVVLHRKSHLLGIILSLALQYWFRSGHIMYGDKDLFWLGQLLSGNSKYEFNKHSAAAIGVVEDGNQICSSQIGHLDEHGKLLWTNGALLACKKNTWLRDYLQHQNLRKKHSYSVFSMRDSYRQPVSIKQAILPASIEELNGDKTLKLISNFRKSKRRGCGGINYCATSEDGGRIFTFSEEEQRNYAEIVGVWNAPY